MYLSFWASASTLVSILLIVSFPDAAIHYFIQLKCWLHRHYARRFGQAAADRDFPLPPWVEPVEHSPRACASVCKLRQEYIALRGYFLRHALGFTTPLREMQVSRWQAFEVWLIGYLLRWGLVKLHQT